MPLQSTLTFCWSLIFKRTVGIDCSSLKGKYLTWSDDHLELGSIFMACEYFISLITLSFSELPSISRSLTTNSRNFSELTPKAHSFGLRQTLYFLIHLKASLRSVVWGCLLLTLPACHPCTPPYSFPTSP